MLRRFGFLLLVAVVVPAFGDMKPLNHPLPATQSKEFVFVVTGDNRPTGHGAPYPHVFPTLLHEIRLIQPALVLWTGDTIYGYNDTPAELKEEYDRFLAHAADADVPSFNAPGNHEIHPDYDPCKTAGDCEKAFKDVFGDLWGSFDYGDSHFIALDSEEIGHAVVVDGKKTGVQLIDGPQLEWLTKDLEAHKDARGGIFVFLHTELTPSPNDETMFDHPPLGNAAMLQKLFTANHVTAVFQGHEHLLYVVDPRTTGGVRYFVAGGAGAPLYAPPENGGVSSYIVVRVSEKGVTYATVEPGRFYAERDEKRSDVIWLVNSNDAALPASRIEAYLPEATWKCGTFDVAAKKLSGYSGVVTITNCAAEKDKITGQMMSHLTMRSSADMPGRKSLEIDITPKK